MPNSTYANRASCRRAAKRILGQDNFTLEQNLKGRWFFTDSSPSIGTSKASRSEHVAKSSIKSPVEVAWAFFADNPKMKRGEVVAALIDQGIATATARTQYQRYRTFGTRAAFLSAEREKR